MTTAKNDLQTESFSGCIRLKEILKSHNMPYEERKEGNAIVIGIKARTFTQKQSQLFKRPCSGTVG